MGATSTGGYRIFISLIVGLGTLVFLSSSGLASCPKGWTAYKYGNGQRCELYSGGKPVLCQHKCDYCGGVRGAEPNETGGPAGGCKSCSKFSVCTTCFRDPDCIDPGRSDTVIKPGHPNGPVINPVQNTTQSAGQGTYNPIHRLKIKPSSDASGSQGAPPCLPPHILYNNGNCGCPSGLTGANCGELVVH
jgi:hypothetical protein